MKKTNRKQRGITLIALIITIIVMLILVGVSVNIALSNGLFKSTQDAARKTEAEKEKEKDISGGQITVDDTKYSSLEEYVNGSTYKYNITIAGVDTGIGFNDTDTLATFSHSRVEVVQTTWGGYTNVYYLKIDGESLCQIYEGEQYSGGASFVPLLAQGNPSEITVLDYFQGTHADSGMNWGAGLYLGEDKTKPVSYKTN